MPPTKNAKKGKGKSKKGKEKVTGDKFDNAFSQAFIADDAKRMVGILEERIEQARSRIEVLGDETAEEHEHDLLTRLKRRNAERVPELLKAENMSVLIAKMAEKYEELALRGEQATEDLRQRLKQGIASVYPELLMKLERIENSVVAKLTTLVIENRQFREIIEQSKGQSTLALDYAL